jgi:isopentenyl diphosphate isomerase/L-lactate dehydrogenase-like FMN-dependent dehydrogenase
MTWQLESAADAIGIDLEGWVKNLLVLDWDYVDRIRDGTSMKLLIKGILTPEDAALCVEHGVDGIVVSNHGGRSEDSGLSTIEALPEIARAVAGRIPILIDSGFRRGTDIVKALALGASAVCVGRPYLWGPGAPCAAPSVIRLRHCAARWLRSPTASAASAAAAA